MFHRSFIGDIVIFLIVNKFPEDLPFTNTHTFNQELFTKIKIFILSDKQ